MNRRFIFLGLLLSVSAGAFAQTWDLQSDFSFTNNPNGAWNYGKYDGSGTFSPNLTQGGFFSFGTGWLGDGGSGRPFVGVNTSGSTSGGALNGQVFVHPDFDSAAHPYAGIHWVSPIADTVNVSVTFYAGDTNTVNEFVSVNALSYIATNANVAGDWTVTFSQAVGVGTFLDFFVGPNSTGNPTSSTTPMDIHITTQSVPEPASFAALGLGLVALVRRRKHD